MSVVFRPVTVPCSGCRRDYRLASRRVVGDDGDLVVDDHVWASYRERLIGVEDLLAHARPARPDERGGVMMR